MRAARGEGLRMSAKVRDSVLTEKKSWLVRDTRLDQALAGRESIVEQQIRSMLAVPLQTESRVIGLIYLDSPFFVREFKEEDLSLLTVMANIAAVRIEHARLAEVEQAERLMAKDLEQASAIQRGLLPEKAPEVPGLDLAGYNVPCRGVGGDYYDFIAVRGRARCVARRGCCRKGNARGPFDVEPPGSRAGVVRRSHRSRRSRRALESCSEGESPRESFHHIFHRRHRPCHGSR